MIKSKHDSGHTSAGDEWNNDQGSSPESTKFIQLTPQDPKFHELKLKLIHLFNFTEDDIHTIEISHQSDHVKMSLHPRKHIDKTLLFEQRPQVIFSRSETVIPRNHKIISYYDGFEIVRRESRFGKTTVMPSAQIALIDFTFPDMNDVTEITGLTNYSEIDRVLREKRRETLELCKALKALGCNVIISQHSLYKHELVQRCLDKLGILLVEGPFMNQDMKQMSIALNCQIISSIASVRNYLFGSAERVEIVTKDNDKICVKVSNIPCIYDCYRHVGLIFRGEPQEGSNDYCPLEITCLVASYLTLKELHHVAISCKFMYRSLLDVVHFKNDSEAPNISEILEREKLDVGS
ncbi:hypothetical protein C9374_002783 [Naegleria lovaniensis]|uniref:Uncharacterized protein n=1 Tax=Naegleria lovaniensis TaxID=51637 RepID=A0AA88KQD4_NAELO|nr:uncharacterized protein C9374_002783 [Naegleria lovaniensis]KAG2386337.1 hypothetical protein C9374_002783 [Naegleria lovaniensis]